MLQDYEFRIYREDGALSLIVHSLHRSDLAAITSALDIACRLALEVWRDADPAASLDDRKIAHSRWLAYRSSFSTSTALPRFWKLETKTRDKLRQYEFRLMSPALAPLIFSAFLTSDDRAAEHAHRLLDRYAMAAAEIWRGMKMVRRV